MNKISLLLAMGLVFSGNAALAADSMMKNDKQDGTMKMQAPHGNMMHKDSSGMMKPDNGMINNKQMGKKKSHHMKHGHPMDKKSMNSSKHKDAMNKM